MACGLRLEFPGAFYRVTSRSKLRETVFKDGAEHKCRR